MNLDTRNPCDCNAPTNSALDPMLAFSKILVGVGVWECVGSIPYQTTFLIFFYLLSP